MPQIKDQQLLQAVNAIVDWRVQRGVIVPKLDDINESYYKKYKLYDEYWNIIIDYGKRWMRSKCKYMPDLIEMYQRYYWNVHVLQYLKEKYREHSEEKEDGDYHDHHENCQLWKCVCAQEEHLIDKWFIHKLN